MDDLLRAIYQRRSRRSYLETPLDPDDISYLQDLILELCGNGDRSIRLVLDNREAFSSFRKSYGLFSGVRNFIALVGNSSNPVETEKLGYYGEMLVLHATTLGLGTCWVGGTFDRASCNLDLLKGERIICVITVGYVTHGLSRREGLIYRLVHRKTKQIDEMYTSETMPPNWFLSGMKAVQIAPSALNRQPVVFTYDKGAVTASVKKLAADYNALDLGIAKLHFELGSGGGDWSFGNGAQFKHL